MLGGAQALGAFMIDYHLPAHPMQAHVKRVVAELCGLHEQDVGWAIDSCNLPTPAFPLDRLAYIYAQLAGSADMAAMRDEILTKRRGALARIYHAMTAHPELVAGEARFCTVLMRAFEGSVVGKLGADGSYGIGIRASEATQYLGAKGAVGLSIKVEDGHVGILYMIVCEVLERLKIGTLAQRRQLEGFHRPKMLNTRGLEVGRVLFPFEMQQH